MTRDELIAKVYERCGWEPEEHEEGGWPLVFYPGKRRWVEDVGLDEFISDIVPVLNERGWGFTLRLTFAHPDGRIRWVAVSNPRESDEWPYQHISPDPVEAAFAVALEVLGE